MADIYLSSKDRRRVYRLPFLPAELPEIARSAAGEEFRTYQDGIYNIPGAAGLRSIALEGILPCKHYSFARSSTEGREVISLLETAMEQREPVRLVVNGSFRVSLLATVEELAWHFDRVGDIQYSATLREYRHV